MPLLVVALGVVVGFPLLTAIALQHVTAAHSIVFIGLLPLATAIFGVLRGDEKPKPAFWLFSGLGSVLVVGFALSQPLSVSPIGDGLALLIATMFSIATVITRRFSHVRMTPATCLGTVFAAVFAALQAGSFAVSASDMGFLFAFGVINLGLGLACFATGARLVPAAIAALLGTFEPLLGPIWVWLVHSEVPSSRTLVGGGIVFAALLVHIAREIARQSRPERPGVTGIPSPN